MLWHVHVYCPVQWSDVYAIVRSISCVIRISLYDAVLTSQLNTFVRQSVLQRDSTGAQRGHLDHYGGDGPLTLYQVMCAVEDKARADLLTAAPVAAEDAIARLLFPDARMRAQEAAGMLVVQRGALFIVGYCEAAALCLKTVASVCSEVYIYAMLHGCTIFHHRE